MNAALVELEEDYSAMISSYKNVDLKLLLPVITTINYDLLEPRAKAETQEFHKLYDPFTSISPHRSKVTVH